MLATSKPGLYVHVPFCASKCRYCAFCSEANSPWVSRWLAAASREAQQYRHDWSGFDSVYVGGGTPSWLRDDGLAELVNLSCRYFRVPSDSELTLEVNPADVTPERAVRWRGMGFNRISIGVQSFRSEELRWLGRRHDARQARAAVDAVRAAGFDNVSLDLLHGLPGQSLAQRAQSVCEAISLQPEHLSCYELTVEKGTPLANAVAAGECILPGPDEQADAFAAAVDLLVRHGYVHYEVSSFARSERLTSRHNTKYWNHTRYLGLGPSAHSFDGRRRWCNVRSVSAYCARIEAGQSALEDSETLSAEQIRAERVALGLRTSAGIARSVLRTAPTTDSRLAALCADGFVRSTPDRVIPTERGLMVADALARALLFDATTVPA